jgi:hypothetical protein
MAEFIIIGAMFKAIVTVVVGRVVFKATRRWETGMRNYRNFTK